MTSRHNSLRLYQPTNSTPDELTEQQLALFTLLQLREQEFGFNPNVIVHYPEAGFLGSPIGYLNQLISEQLQQGYFINQVVILTTYQILNSPLMQAGYQHEAVHMPAGPDHTAIFRWQCGTRRRVACPGQSGLKKSVVMPILALSLCNRGNPREPAHCWPIQCWST